MNEQHNENERTIEQIQGVLKEVSRRIQKNLELLDSLRQAREILETILEEARARKAEKEPKTDNNTQEKDDPLYPDAVKLFRKEKRISVSFLQRSFAIGYGRAKKLLTTMAAEGIFDGTPINEDERPPRGRIIKLDESEDENASSDDEPKE